MGRAPGFRGKPRPLKAGAAGFPIVITMKLPKPPESGTKKLGGNVILKEGIICFILNLLGFGVCLLGSAPSFFVLIGLCVTSPKRYDVYTPRPTRVQKPDALLLTSLTGPEKY